MDIVPFFQDADAAGPSHPIPSRPPLANVKRVPSPTRAPIGLPSPPKRLAAGEKFKFWYIGEPCGVPLIGSSYSQTLPVVESGLSALQQLVWTRMNTLTSGKSSSSTAKDAILLLLNFG